MTFWSVFEPTGPGVPRSGAKGPRGTRRGMASQRRAVVDFTGFLR
jgi:hypothetical protein